MIMIYKHRMDEIKIYRLTQSNVEIDLDGNKIESEEAIGMFRVAETNNPAMQTMGFAFNDDNASLKLLDTTKDAIYLEDEVKMRIASPIIIPNLLIERNEKLKNGKSEKYFVYFSEEDAEYTYKQFMKNLKTTSFFMKKHTEDRSDSFLFESIILDTPSKVTMAKESYGFELPLYSVIMVRQYNNLEAYTSAVLNNRTGASLEGLYDMVNVKMESQKEDSTNKKQNKNMKKVLNNTFFEFESMEVGAKVIDIQSDTLATFDFEENEKKYTITDGIITEIVDIELEETEEETETVEETVEVETEEVIEDEDENKEVVTALDNDEVLAIVKPELDALYDALATLQAKIDSNKTEVEFEDQTKKNVNKMIIPIKVKFTKQ